MSSIRASSAAAPVAAESQATPVFNPVEVGGRGRLWLRFTSSSAPRLWLCEAFALTVASALGTTTADAAANPVWPPCFGVIVITLLASRGHHWSRLEPRHLDVIRAVLTLTVVAAAFTITLPVFVGNADNAASEMTRLWILAATSLVASRLWIALTGWRAAVGMADSRTSLLSLAIWRLRSKALLGSSWGLGSSRWAGYCGAGWR